jgi:uncharacterized protein (TIGR03086 family)
VETVDLLEQGFAFARERIAGIGETPLDAPTPCEDWDLRQLVNHAVNAVTIAAGVLSGESDVDPWSRSPGELADTDAGWPHPEARFGEVTGAIVAACREGALERRYPMRGTELPGEFLARACALDSVLHGWDIAKATGQDATIPTAVADEILPHADGLPDQARVATFGPRIDVPNGATASDRLVAVLGRQP